MENETLYLKIDKNVQSKGNPVYLRDIASINCAKKPVENKVKTLRLPTEIIKGPGRYVFSVLDVIETIQKEYPNLEINNLGESDFIITVEKDHTPSDAWSWCKTVLVCLLAFFGAAFSIMAFNNDVGVTTLFGQLYEQFTGNETSGFTVLEISYSIGVGMGILLFFHHFAKKKGMSDPTPLEVEMRTYEDDVDMTLVESGNRKEKTL
ncbi:MAG: stage V sporulation protein AA [Lachnospiraceae bacterium]|nr:stage V sporulation protein AA [Lachnospiraceae bacterium]